MATTLTGQMDEHRRRSGIEALQRKFADRATTPEEEASLAQHLGERHYREAQKMRVRRDLGKRFAAVDRVVPEAIASLSNRNVDSKQSIAAGLGVLIELLHCESVARRQYMDRGED